MTARAALVLLSVSLAVGCVLKRSAPARLYVLDATAARHAAAPPAGAVPVVGVLRVSVPAWLDRPEIAARGPDGEVLVDEGARWGEPLGRGVQRVVAENLSRLRPDRRVLTEPFPLRQVLDVRLDLAITEAARQADGSVLVEARWALLARDGSVLGQHHFTHRAAALRGPAAAVAATSEGLAELSRAVAGALPSLSPPE